MTRQRLDAKMPKVSDSDAFISLVSAAEKDPALAKRILAIVKLPEIERKIKVQILVKDCYNKQAPKDFIKALTFLAEENTARRLCEFLDT